MAQIKTKFITDAAVTNVKLANMAATTLKGNSTGSPAAPSDLSVATVQTMLSIPTSSSPLPLNAGGTGISAASANAAFNALSPLTTKGDVLGFSTVNARLAVGTDGQVLSADSTQSLGLKWVSAATGSVTSVALTVPAFLSVSGSPITSSGTLAVSFSGTALPIANGGTAATTAAAAFNNLNPMTTTGDLIYESATNVASRLPIGTTGQVLTVVGGIPAWANDSDPAMTIGSFNSQVSSANGLVIAANVLYAQAATTSNPGMVSVPAAGGLALSTAALSINVDSSTVKINGSNQLESIQPNEERITLSGTDITNQYVDLAQVIFGSSASVNSAQLFVVGGPQQLKTVDYTVSLTGGSGGVTRISFAGDLATGGPAALIAGDILVIDYQYLA